VKEKDNRAVAGKNVKEVSRAKRKKDKEGRKGNRTEAPPKREMGIRGDGTEENGASPSSTTRTKFGVTDK